MIEETQSADYLQVQEIPLSSIWKSPLKSLVHGLVIESVAYSLLVALELTVGLFWVQAVVPPEYAVMQIPIYIVTVLSIGCAMGFINQIVSVRLWSFRRPYSRRALCAQGMILLTFSAFLMGGLLRITSSSPLQWVSFLSPLISLAAILIVILASPLYAFIAINMVSWDVNLHDERGRSEAFGTKARCDFCDAVYAYKEEDVREEGIVYCQNCAKGFQISSSTNSYKER